MADVGGPFDSRSYGYDGRGNRTSQVNEDCAYTLTYGASGHPDELTQRASACTSAMLKHSYAYDRDGRVTSKTWAQKLDGSTPYAMLFGSGETDSSSNGALDTVLKSVSVNGAVYNYFYDAFNRRRLKVYPTGNTDELFHSGNDELLVDRGLSSVTSPTALPIDQYVWLGGRPVILVRGQMSTGFSLQSDATASCPRNGDAAACGFYFPITDHIGKPVLMLDANRKVAGIGEYDPFGQLNRVSLDAESPHPYSPTPPASTIMSVDFKQPVGGSANPSTALSLRALIHLAGIKTYTTFGSGTGIHHIPPATSSTATMSLVDADTSTALWSSSSGGSNFFTGWVQPSAGHAKLNFTTNGWPSCAVGDDPPDFSLCFGSGTFSDDLTGVVMEGYEYRRYQSGTQWFWTPLRFPGQYYDPETDLAQNWNRFYETAAGRYVSVEPLLESATYVATSAVNGEQVSSYSYADDNPVSVTDDTGLYSEVCWRKIKGPLSVTEARHCFIRNGGAGGDTSSYYATLPIDPWFKKVGPDLNPAGALECHLITPPPTEPQTCDNSRTPFDQCLQTAMQYCASCTYNIKTNNCCECAAGAIAQCGGTYKGPWPSNYGWGPR